MDKLIDQEGDLSVWHLSADKLFEFSDQVYAVYAGVYGSRHGWRSSITDLKDIYSEDLRYARNSTFLAIKFGSQLLCTGRMTQKRMNMVFPLEAEFGINIQRVLGEYGLNPREVWHCGRATMNKELLGRLELPRSFSAYIFKTLLYYGFQHMGQHESNVVFAESDKATHRIYAGIGMKWRKLSAERSDYLGSPTFATMIPVDEVHQLDWYQDFSLKQVALEQV